MFLPQVAMAPTGTEVGNGDAIDVREPAQFGVELYLCAGVHDVEFAAREIVHDGSVAELVDALHRVDLPPGRLDPVRLRLERSEERRVGHGCVSTFQSRWSP